MIDAEWNKKAEEAFVGKRIISASYMSKEEAEEQDWYSRPLVLGLDDGTFICPMSDDEGNDGGALAGGMGTTFPVL